MRMSMRPLTRPTNGFSQKLENHAATVARYFMYYNSPTAGIRRCASRQRWRLDSPTMSGPSKESSPSGHELDSLLLRVKRLRQDAEAFQRTLEEELRTTRTLIDDLRVGQAKRRRQ